MELATGLIFSAVFAGSVAVAVTVAIERWGGVVGGFLGTVPTTIVPAAIGIASQSDHGAFSAAMQVAPAAMVLNAGFLYLWRVLPPRLPGWPFALRLLVMVVASLGCWMAGAFVMVEAIRALRASSIPLGLLGGATALFMALTGAAACLRPVAAPRGARRVGAATLAARGVLAAASIAASVWLAAHGGEVAAGIAAVFPAIFLTTMVSLWLSQGEAVPAGAVGPMMLGSTSVAVFSLLAAHALPLWGPFWGCGAAWLFAVGTVTVPATLWLSRRRLGQQQGGEARSASA